MEFESARQEAPADATVRFSLGFMYWKVRRFGEAESELQETLKLDAHFTPAKYYLADAYLTHQKPERALPLLESLVREEPGNARALVDLGKTFDKLNRAEDAVRAYRAALGADPNRADAHYQLARVYKKLNRTTESQRELDTAQRLQQQKREREESLLNAFFDAEANYGYKHLYPTKGLEPGCLSAQVTAGRIDYCRESFKWVNHDYTAATANSGYYYSRVIGTPQY